MLSVRASTGSQVKPTFQISEVSGRRFGLPDAQVAPPFRVPPVIGSAPKKISPQPSFGSNGRASAGVGARKLSPTEPRKASVGRTSHRNATLGVVVEMPYVVNRS